VTNVANALSATKCKRIVLTGGPGAGKTAVLELARLHICEHVAVLPESASMLFGGGFPRSRQAGPLKAAQRAIYSVQHELEIATEAEIGLHVLLCDRGTIDGAAYWPAGTDTLWSAVGTTVEAELARYSAVIHLRTPRDEDYTTNGNPVRIEGATEAAMIDERIAELWRSHPGYHVVPSAEDFVAKAQHALVLLLAQLPRCCAKADRAHARVASTTSMLL
jgi:predicted ATPase